MKNSNDTIGNRTRDLPACSSVLQPTAPPRAPYKEMSTFKKKITLSRQVSCAQTVANLVLCRFAPVLFRGNGLLRIEHVAIFSVAV